MEMKLITLRDEQTARRQAVRLGMKLHRSGNLYALSDHDTNKVVMGLDPDDRPIATIQQVLEWLAKIDVVKRK